MDTESVATGNPKRKRDLSIREFPQLAASEEFFMKSNSQYSLSQRMVNARRDANLLRDRYTAILSMPEDLFEMTVFRNAHPEYDLLMANPDEPCKDMIPDVFFGHAIPATNRTAAFRIYNEWKNKERFDDRLVRARKKCLLRVKKLEDSAINLSAAQKRLTKLQELATTPGHVVGREVYDFFRSLLRTRENLKNKSTKGKMRALLLPILAPASVAPDNGLFRTLRISAENQEFVPFDVFIIRDVDTSKRNIESVVAVLDMDGTLHPRKDVYTSTLIQCLSELLKDPEEYVSLLGKLIGTCCMCGKRLIDDFSLAVGMGRICQKSLKQFIQT